MTSAPSGERPKFVWTRMPVPLMTGWMRDARTAARPARTRTHYGVRIGNGLLLCAQRLKLPAHHIEHDRARQPGGAERLHHRVDRGNRAKARRLHGLRVNRERRAVSRFASASAPSSTGCSASTVCRTRFAPTMVSRSRQPGEEQARVAAGEGRA